MKKYLLVYDADCGPCTRFKRVVDFFDKYNRLDFTSLIEADKRGLLNSIPKFRRHLSFHLISSEGSVQSGANAIPELLTLFPSGKIISKLITLAPGGKRMIGFVYSVSSRLHDFGSCGYERSSSSEESSY